MASETVDKIDWLLPPTIYKAEATERHFQIKMNATNHKRSMRYASTFETLGGNASSIMVEIVN